MSDLPADWKECQSKSNPGAVYYFNAKTGETRWDRPTGIRCRHILVKHSGSRRPSSWKTPVITRSKEEAIQLVRSYRSRITSGEVSFEDLASNESDCSSAKQQGDLGFFGRGEMQKAFEDAAFALKVGEISDVVDSDSGIHIILRTD